MNVPVLAYHKVDLVSHTRFWISVDSFDRQMTALKDLGFASVCLNELRRCAHGDGALPEKPVCITFDDGYANFAARAFPILVKHGFTATVFLPTAYIGDGVRQLNAWDRSPEERSFAAAHLVWPEVIDLHRSGIEFGAHTRTHRDLEDLFMTSPLEAEEEITESRREIEARLGVETMFFSYPYRAAGPGVEALVRNAGYAGALTVNGKSFDTLRGDWYCIDRIPVYPDRPGMTRRNVRDAFIALLGESAP